MSKPTPKKPRAQRPVTWRSLVDLLTNAVWGMEHFAPKDHPHVHNIQLARRLARQAVDLARQGEKWREAAEDLAQVRDAYRARDRALAELADLERKPQTIEWSAQHEEVSLELESARATLAKHGEPHP